MISFFPAPQFPKNSLALNLTILATGLAAAWTAAIAREYENLVNAWR